MDQGQVLGVQSWRERGPLRLQNFAVERRWWEHQGRGGRNVQRLAHGRPMERGGGARGERRAAGEGGCVIPLPRGELPAAAPHD